MSLCEANRAQESRGKVLRVTLTFNQRILSVRFGKFFPIYIRLSGQNDVVDFGKLFGTPEGQESGRVRFTESQGSVVGKIARASFRLLLRSGNDDEQPLCRFSRQAALVTN